MPIYLFEHEKTKEVREIFFRMNDKKIYNGENGKEIGVWHRIFTCPTANIDSISQIQSANDFVRITGQKKGSMGDLMSLSKELSEKRAAQNGGIDPIKEKHKKQWEKQNGVKYIEKRPKDWEYTL